MRKILVGASAAAMASLSVADGKIVITEIMYNPASAERKNQTEWVEIANVGDAPVAMRGWKLDDEDKDNFGAFNVTLDPGGVAVLINGDECTEAQFRGAWDSASAPKRTYTVIPVAWGSLANTPGPDNEILQLLDDRGAVQCEVRQTGGGWPKVGSGGASIVLIDPHHSDASSGPSWQKAAVANGAFACAVNEVFDKPDMGSPGMIPGAGTASPPSQSQDPVIITQAPSEDSGSDGGATGVSGGGTGARPNPAIRPPRKSPNSIDY